MIHRLRVFHAGALYQKQAIYFLLNHNYFFFNCIGETFSLSKNLKQIFCLNADILFCIFVSLFCIFTSVQIPKILYTYLHE